MTMYLVTDICYQASCHSALLPPSALVDPPLLSLCSAGRQTIHSAPSPTWIPIRDLCKFAYDLIHLDFLCSCSLSRDFPLLRGTAWGTGQTLPLPPTCTSALITSLLIVVFLTGKCLSPSPWVHPSFLRHAALTHASLLCSHKVFTIGTWKSRAGYFYSSYPVL